VSKWPHKSLGEVAVIERDSIQPGEIKTGTSYLGLEHIESGGKILSVPEVSNGDLASSKFQFTSKHILYGKLRPYLAKIACPDFNGICSTDILPILPNDNMDKRFICYFLRQPDVVALANSRSSGANLPRLSPTTLSELLLPVPPLSEQKRIAEILDLAESLRRQRRTALALLDELTQSIFLDMFGDPVSNSMDWPLQTFQDLGTLDRGISKNRPRNSPNLLGGVHPLIQTGDIASSGGYIRKFVSTYSDEGLKQSKKWPAGTLCITIAANIAKTGVLTFDACFPDSVVGFKSDHATVEYTRVWLSFLQKMLEDAAPESAQKNINLATLRRLPVPVPPLTKRSAFASRISAVEFLKAVARRGLEELDQLFASLQHRAFRGEL
jgi:type I restriction enzyme S subunit